MKKKLILEDLDPGPLTGKPILWRCWRIGGHMDRRRLEGPREVIARTSYEARQLAALNFQCEPLAVETQFVIGDSKKQNGAVR